MFANILKDLKGIPSHFDDGDTGVSTTPECTLCKHLNKDTLACSAFPEGVPWKIYLGAVNHHLPLPGDNGFQFEPI